MVLNKTITAHIELFQHVVDSFSKETKASLEESCDWYNQTMSVESEEIKARYILLFLMHLQSSHPLTFTEVGQILNTNEGRILFKNIIAS